MLAKYDFVKIHISNSTIQSLPLDLYHTCCESSVVHLLEELSITNSTFVTDSLIQGTELFSFITHAPVLKTLIIKGTNLKEVPDSAFTDTSSKLTRVELSSNMIERIGTRALQHLSSLTWIDLSENKLKEVGAQAFYFKEKSDKPISIDLGGNDLTSQSLNESSFQLESRPAVIYLRNNNITFMRESIFASIVRSPSVRLFSDGNPLKCYDCRNSWMKKVGQSYEDMNDIICSETGRSIYELDSKTWSFCQVSTKDILSSMKDLSSLLKSLRIISPSHSDHLEKLVDDLRDDL